MLFLQLLLQQFNLGAIMAITANNTTLTFNDATTQTTSGVTSVGAGTGISSSGGKTPTITNTGVTSVSGAGTVTVSASTGGVTITGTGGSGTVTSVATGNGLSGGTITSTGTLVVACPSFNSVGSYVFGSYITSNPVRGPAAGGTIAAGSATGQLRSCKIQGGPTYISAYNNLSGTWRLMGGANLSNYDETIVNVFCRVS
jgi:trimeric autotransporter adhesin